MELYIYILSLILVKITIINNSKINNLCVSSEDYVHYLNHKKTRILFVTGRKTKYNIKEINKNTNKIQVFT